MTNTRGGGSFETNDRFDSDLSLPRFQTGQLEQLPRVTSKATLYRLYSLLLSASLSAFLCQLLALFPPVRLQGERVPFVALGAALVVVGVSKSKGKQTPGIAEAAFGVFVGAVIGI
jgi:hypothetical protein